MFKTLMLTTKECYFNNGGQFTCKDNAEVVREAERLHKMGLTPDKVYRYNPDTDRYDILVGRLTIKKQEA